MTTHSLAPDCDADFACAECGRVVCTDSEVVICRCSDDPTCDPCCAAYHGGAA